MQYTNIISIDPSTTCTGLCINSELYCFAAEDSVKTKKGKYKKWFGIADQACTIITYSNSSIKNQSFSDSEIEKLKKYNIMTEKIVDTIKINTQFKNSICLIEGYSYNSAAGNLIDLVTYSTLLRYKLHTNGVHVVAIPPTTLKMAAAKLTYPPIDIGKKKPKLEWRNSSGVAAGSFKKHEIYKAIIENTTLEDTWAKLLREYASDQLNAKDIPKPFNDINDSYVLYHGYQAGHINT